MDTILCDELLEEVFHRLPPPSSSSTTTTADISLVSKRWLRLYRSSKSTLSLHLSPDNSTPLSLSSFLSHFPYLSSLSLSTPAPSDAGSTFSDNLLLSAASSCPKLRILRLHSGPVSFFPLLSLSTSCPHLTSLSISLSRPVSFHFLLFFHSLKTLALSFLSLPTEFDHADAPSSSFSVDAEIKLETLVLSGIRSGDCGFNWLWKICKKLKKLQLHSCEGIGNDTSVSSFVNCVKGLQEVELRSCRTIVNEILSKLAENCTSLSSLVVYDGCSREGLLHFITQSRCNLQKLDLRLPLDLENSHLFAVAENFRSLSSLRLQSCCLVTGEGLKTIGVAMSDDLEELALINCDVVEREPGLLTTLGQSLRNLRKLDLSYNEMLVDKEFISMLASCNCLRELKVRGCKGLTNVSLVSMFKSCKQLESVDIMNCRGIEAEAVELFVLNCMGLRQINVEESKLSDVSRLRASKKLVV
ncbi:hypothetical protein Vadar_030161 [Vaccinium darrowii]|uniref:Uncharacterized protein n=1 Tax=Vaccinium darrowii TaxID=229202 RepID=A0ACB7YHF9_9ERIC|nr:hypothetical protein Vadar_030161 [Vaccinium darrowii]